MELFITFLSLLALFSTTLAWHADAPIPHEPNHIHPSDSNHNIEPARLVMYVQTFQTPSKEPLSLLPLLERETKVTHVILASLHLHDVPGEIRLNDHKLSDPHWNQLWLEKTVLQHNGIKVMALLGGAAGGTYKRLNGSEASFYAFYNPLLRLLKEHNFDGIDLDIEEDVDISTPIRLMTALRRDLGPDFIITMAPLASALSDKAGQNLSGFSYFDLDIFATMPGSDEKLVSWYNGLFYGGFARGPPFFESVVRAGWDPNRVVMVVLDCAEDGQPNGFVHIETLQETIKSLRGLHPSLGGVGGWEYHDAGMSDWEEYEPWEWVKKVGNALFDLPPNPPPIRKNHEL